MLMIKPDWPAPANIRAYTTSRKGGVSVAPYDQLNLGVHVGDDIHAVEENRRLLAKELNLPKEPFWLNQTHSTEVLPYSEDNENRTADASFAKEKHQVCVVLTADCLPILLCDRRGTQIAAIHAGWKGLLHGVIETTLKQLTCAKNEILVWLGPAISIASYEVGNEVREQFVKKDSEATSAFVTSRPGHWMMDIYQLAKLRLHQQGITAIYGGEFCTFLDSDKFYSYRRDGNKTGRMATLIYLTDEDELDPLVR